MNEIYQICYASVKPLLTNHCDITCEQQSPQRFLYICPPAGAAVSQAFAFKLQFIVLLLTETDRERKPPCVA